MAFIADPSLNEVYRFGSNAIVTLLNARTIQLNKASVDSTDAFYVNVTGGTGRAAVLTGGVMVGPTAAVADGNLDIVVDGASAATVATAYGTGNAPAFRGRAARGTLASPTASQNGDLLSSFSARGYGTTAFASTSAGRYGIYASENWTDSAQGTSIQLETTANGTTTRLVRSIFTNDGRIVIGATEAPSVPALKASGTTLQVKLGDDSAFAPLTGTILTGNTSVVGGNVTVSTGTVNSATFLNLIATTGALDVNTQAAQPVTISTNGTLRWTVGSTGHLTGNTDNSLDIGAAGTTGRVRNLYSGTKLWVGDSTGTRASIDASGNFYTSGQNEHIGTETAHSVFVDTNSIARWEFQSAGHIQAGADNTYDIGGSGSNNPRSIYAATSLITAGNVTVSSGNLSSTGNAGAFFIGSTTNSVNVNIKAAGTTSSILVGGTDNVFLATGASAAINRWQVDANGHFLGGTDNTYDIGASGATRPRTGYFGTSVVVGNTVTVGTAAVTGSAALLVQATAAALDLTATGANAVNLNTNGTTKVAVTSLMTLADAFDIVVGTTTGTKIGTSTTQKLGFWNSSPVARQSSAALTNNVTSGGTTDTIDNFTDLTIYSNDASTIRNDIYQLSRKLKEISDALRLYGILG